MHEIPLENFLKGHKSVFERYAHFRDVVEHHVDVLVKPSQDLWNDANVKTGREGNTQSDTTNESSSGGIPGVSDILRPAPCRPW